MSRRRPARDVLLALAVALVLAAIGLVVSVSRAPGGEIKFRARVTTAVDQRGCLTCHNDLEYEPEVSSRPWREFLVDEVTLASSTHGSVDCAECHLTFATGQRIKAPAVQELCGRCHHQERVLQQASAHAEPRVATCLDCHSPGGTGHDIPPVLSESSPAFPGNVAETCGGCHADEQLMERYGLKTDIHDVYLDSPHGKVMKLVGSDVDGLYPATCTSCHGSHDVMDTDDPASPVSSTGSLAAVCASCHPGANEEFASTLALHEEFASKELSQIAFYGERFFFVLTAGVVGLGLLMVGLEGVGWLTGRAHGGHGRGSRDSDDDDRDDGDIHGSGGGDNPRGGNPKGDPDGHSPGGSNPGDNPASKPGDCPEETANDPHAATATLSPHETQTAQADAVPRARLERAPSLARRSPLPEEIVRFDVSQRLQHFVLMSSFLVLAFTGLPQKFPDWEVSQWLIGVWGGLDAARTIHRFAGLVMITDCLYHLGYVVYGTAVLKKPVPIWMIPTPKDLMDLFQDLQCWFGLSSEKPQFGRFSYREKFDYWAIFWGMPVMAISGLVLMFPVLVSNVLPGDAVSVALVAHGDEAILAILWIFIVHMFFVHLNPRFFPLNRAIFTGRMSREAYADEHALELAKIEARLDGGSQVRGADRAANQVRGRATGG
jgi:formate dehydrogenase subunit gamma